MTETLSKSRFQARALEFLHRVESTGEELVITNRGRPVVKIVPYVEEPERMLNELRGTVLRYDHPEEPVEA